MYVDPQIQKFLDDLTAENPPHPVDMGLEAARDGSHFATILSAW